MFRQNTTIIVGAGASCELGLPSGDKLKHQIIGLLRPTRDNAYGFSDNAMIELMKLRVGGDSWNHQQKLAPVMEAAEKIRKGLPLALSIDNFLHSHQGDAELEQLGKLAIAICIIRAEQNSHLFARQRFLVSDDRADRKPQPSLHNDGLAASWYPAFVSLLVSGIQRDNIAEAFEKLRFIIFNYDRCLEQYIWMALQDYFDIDEKEASEILSSVSFIHPYGHLGPLPWQGKQDSVALGTAPLQELMNIAPRIRTFTESVRSEVGGQVQAAVNWGETLLILGFGYLDQNIQLLHRQPEVRGSRVFSTAFRVSEPDQLVMKDAMMVLGGVTADAAMIDPGSCRDLFDHYRLHLSLR